MNAISNNLHEASHQWATRPDDQRYLSLADLKAAVAARKSESWTATPRVADLRVIPSDTTPGGLSIDLYDAAHGARRQIAPTHWGFGQLASYAQAPASYLRRLPAELAAINLQWGLERNAVRDDALILARSNGTHELRAMTSSAYGRIWDSQVVEAVERINTDGRWQVPAASYATSNPRRATTLYASDRDVFIFLVDPTHPIEVPGEDAPLYRGFYCWNSEVGAQVFGLCTFLYRYVCDNRIIWGATEVKELRIRHTSGAPERFAYEGARYLNRYSEASTAGIVASITAAKAKELPDAGQKDGVATWLQFRGFTRPQAQAAVDAAIAEEGKARTLWDIVQGITAHARSIPYADERTDLEAKAGKLMAAAA
jgi:hypothetical protein